MAENDITSKLLNSYVSKRTLELDGYCENVEKLFNDGKLTEDEKLLNFGRIYQSKLRLADILKSDDESDNTLSIVYKTLDEEMGIDGYLKDLDELIGRKERKKEGKIKEESIGILEKVKKSKKLIEDKVKKATEELYKKNKEFPGDVELLNYLDVPICGKNYKKLHEIRDNSKELTEVPYSPTSPKRKRTALQEILDKEKSVKIGSIGKMKRKKVTPPKELIDYREIVLQERTDFEKKEGKAPGVTELTDIVGKKYPDIVWSKAYSTIGDLVADDVLYKERDPQNPRKKLLKKK